MRLFKTGVIIGFDMAVKSNYKGIFNLHNEIKREFAYAFSKKQATKIIVDRMAKKQGVLPKVIWYWMKDHPNSYEIKTEMEWEEIEDEN